MTLFTGLLIFVFITLVTYYLVYEKKKHNNFPPGPPRLPFWGSYWFMLKENYRHAHLSLQKLAEKYNTNVLGVYLGDYPAIATFGYDICKEVLTREEFLGRNDTIVTRSRGLGNLRGIFFVEQQHWRAHRRFSLRHLRDFGFGRRSKSVERFAAEEVKCLVDILSKDPDLGSKDIWRARGQVLLPDIFYGSFLNTIALMLCSERYDDRRLLEFGRSALRFQRGGDATGCALSITPWLRHIAPEFFGYKAVIDENTYLLDFIKGIVEEHKKTFSDDYHRDFIDVFLSMQRKGSEYYDALFTDDQLLLVLLDYLFPSAIAISHTLNFYFAHIINNPEIQQKVYEEIDRVVGRSRLPSLDDRIKMPYAEATIREGLRLIPINPLGIPRRCIQDTTLGGYFIPKDTIIMPSIISAHHDRRIWKKPEQFYPENFLDAHGNLLKKDYILGFGAGRRLCAGETFARNMMFLFVTGLLQSYYFKSADGNKVALDDKTIIPGANLSIDNNWIQVVVRDI